MRRRLGTRAPKEIFCCKPVSAHMQRLANVAAILLVLSLIGTKVTPRRDKPRARPGQPAANDTFDVKEANALLKSLAA